MFDTRSLQILANDSMLDANGNTARATRDMIRAMQYVHGNLPELRSIAEKHIAEVAPFYQN